MSRSIAAVLASLTLAVAGSAHAFRVMEKVEGSVELALRELALPSGGRAAVMYRPCAACPLKMQSVTARTTYYFNGRVVTLVELLAAVDEVRQRPADEARAVAFVHYDLNTEDVNRVRVHAGD